MFTKQQNDRKLNNEDVSTDETCPAFQNILGIPCMIKKPGNFGKSRACLENAQLFLQTTNTCPAFSTKTAYPAQD